MDHLRQALLSLILCLGFNFSAAGKDSCQFPPPMSLDWLLTKPGNPPEAFTIDLAVIPGKPLTIVKCPECPPNTSCNQPCFSKAFLHFEVFPRLTAAKSQSEIWALVKAFQEDLKGARIRAFIRVTDRPRSIKTWPKTTLEASKYFALEIECYEVISRGDK